MWHEITYPFPNMSSKMWHEITYPFQNMSSKMWDEFTYPLPTVEVWEWISNLIPHFIVDVITYPWITPISNLAEVCNCVSCGDIIMIIYLMSGWMIWWNACVLRSHHSKQASYLIIRHGFVAVFYLFTCCSTCILKKHWYMYMLFIFRLPVA